MNALMLSAGLGTRFRPVTDRVAKPAIPFLNVPLLGYSLYYLENLFSENLGVGINDKSCRLENLVLNTHHLPASVEGAANCLTHGQDYRVLFSFEPEILGSGGGILKARELLGAGPIAGSRAGGGADGGADAGSRAGANAESVAASRAGANDFIVCNADEVLLFNHSRGFAPLVEFHKSSGALATLLTTDHPEAGKTLGGVWAEAGGSKSEADDAIGDADGVGTSGGGETPSINTSGKIYKLGGQGIEPGARHFTGVYVFSERIFDYMPASGKFHIFKDCLHKAMAAGESVLSFHDSDLTWLDMSSEKDYISSTLTALQILSGDGGESAANAEASTSAGAAAISTAKSPIKSAGISPAKSSAYSRVKAENLKNILKRFHQKFELMAPSQWLCPGAKFAGELAPSSFLFMGPDSEIGADVRVKGFAVLGAGAKLSQGVIDHSVLAPGVHVNPIASLRNEIVI
ncbi:MAG: hypothetical protein KDD38_03620 [Bdellovibrionales bacterium]|nr:hypothetical protein [Bdellovibrionales bacterium]